MDRIVQYVIVRGDLTTKLAWPLGALIAQCCHATTAVAHLYRDDPDTLAYFDDLDNMHKVVLVVRIPPINLNNYSLIKSVQQTRQADDEPALRKLAQTLDDNAVKHKLWIEMPENTPTCIALKPYRKDDVHKFVKKFKLLK